MRRAIKNGVPRPLRRTVTVAPVEEHCKRTRRERAARGERGDAGDARQLPAQLHFLAGKVPNPDAKRHH